MKLFQQAEVYAPEYLGRKDVLVCGKQVQWIRDRIYMEDSGCQVIDGRGKMLLPGLIDQHIHIIGGGGEGSFHTRTPEVMLSALVRGGVTTVVGLLGTDGVARNVETLLAKAKALKEEGITCYVCTGSYGYPSVTLTGNVEKDVVFIEEVLGVKLAISDHRASNVTTEELIRLASDVRRAGMLSGKPGIVVLHMGDDGRGFSPVFEALGRTSIPPGTFRPTHVSRTRELFAQALEFAKQGGYIDITAGGNSGIGATDCLRMAQECHVPPERVTFSSDGQGSWSNYDEEGHLLEIGVSGVDGLYRELARLVVRERMSLESVLPHMTSYVADSLGLSRKGHIREGADADLLLLNADFTLDGVFAMGCAMMEGGRLKRWGTFETVGLK